MLEEKVQAYRALTQQIAALEAEKKKLGEEIIALIPGKCVQLAGCKVWHMQRLNFKTSLEVAKELGATKMQEVLDKKRLKELLEDGHDIPDVSTLHYVQITQPRKMAAATPSEWDF